MCARAPDKEASPTLEHCVGRLLRESGKVRKHFGSTEDHEHDAAQRRIDCWLLDSAPHAREHRICTRANHLDRAEGNYQYYRQHH